MNLQSVLALLGIMLLAGIYLWSRWQQRHTRAAPKARDHAPSHPGRTRPDPELSRRPTNPHSAATEYASNRPSAAAAVAAAPAAAPEQVDAATAHTTFQVPTIDGFEKLSQIDYWAKLSGTRDVSRDSVLAVYHTGAPGLTKPHSIHGLRLPDKVWYNLENESETARFTDLVLTIQLADQQGAITSDELHRFTRLVHTLSETTDRGYVFMATTAAALQQAHALAQYANHYDYVFVVNIKPVAADYFTADAIHRYACELGLEPAATQYYVRYRRHGNTKQRVYNLANLSETGQFDFDNLAQQQTRGVTLFTRLALHHSPSAVFVEMVNTAKVLAAHLKGKVVMPGKHDFTPENIEQMCQFIETLVQQMQHCGLSPGSQEALRLFRAE